MMWALKQLLVPCNYLRIKHGPTLFKSKSVYDYIFPFLLTAATVGLCVLVDVPLKLAGHKAIFASLANLLALLIAFYMAALAAVSTFARRGIDKGMRGGDAILLVLNHATNRREPKSLSYRQFISYLFGYLAFLSLMLFLSLIFFGSIWPHVTKAAGHYGPAKIAAEYIEPTIFVLFVFGFWQMLVTSALGIYFLSDRIQSLNDPHH